MDDKRLFHKKWLHPKQSMLPFFIENIKEFLWKSPWEAFLALFIGNIRVVYYTTTVVVMLHTVLPNSRFFTWIHKKKIHTFSRNLFFYRYGRQTKLKYGLLDFFTKNLSYSKQSMLQCCQIHTFSREFTKFHTFSREFTWIRMNSHKKFTLFRVNSREFTWIRVNSQIFTLFHEIFFLPVWTANKAKNSLSWAFSQKIFYFSYKRR
jgi:hypothetical protein